MAILDGVVRAMAAARTPLTLAAASLVILYGLISQLLKLDIFSKMQSHETYILLSRLIDWLFYLAIITVVIGALCWLAQLRRRQSPDVNVRSTGVSDNTLYTADRSGDDIRIRPREQDGN